jgi:hypothetical protein
MKNLGIFALLISFFLCPGNFGQIVNFAQENSLKKVPVELENVKVKDVSKVLNQKEREEIVRLVTKSYIKIVQQRHPDYIDLQTPLYRLLRTNFPDIKDREEERGISLGNIVRFLNSNPENRKIINSVLSNQKAQKCL